MNTSSRVESTLTFPSSASSQKSQEFLTFLIQKCTDIQKTNPGNLCCKYLPSYLTSRSEEGLSNQQLADLVQCVKSGITNPSSSVGCYARSAEDYNQFLPFFDQVIRDYHQEPNPSRKHVTNWDVKGVDNFDVASLGIENLSVRVRVGRNVQGFRLSGEMDRNERIELEFKLLQVFKTLKQKQGGDVFSLSPNLGRYGDNPNLITKEKYDQLVSAHVMFKDSSQDSFLRSAGIADDWPFGRGCWRSADGNNIVWYGEEDHVRVICMKHTKNLLEPFQGLKDLLTAIECTGDISFYKNDTFGYVTACPSNLGTAMRASVHLNLPNLTRNGNTDKLKALCDSYGLSVRGKGGEHTPVGEDGTVDISPSARLFVSEAEIIGKLFQGIKSIMSLENSS